MKSPKPANLDTYPHTHVVSSQLKPIGLELFGPTCLVKNTTEEYLVFQGQGVLDPPYMGPPPAVIESVILHPQVPYFPSKPSR